MTQVAKGLLNHSNQESVAQLGDRSKYIGMSDIGKGAECMRAAVANKVYGCMHPSSDDVSSWYGSQQYDKVTAALKKQLILQRGHWFEAGIMQAFKANGAKFFTQLEICDDFDGVPIKAHLDFLLIWGGMRPAIRILELKSTENIPESLYLAYETQLYGQLGFLVKCWNQPSFSIRDGTGQIIHSKISFPELVKRMFGFDISNTAQDVDIEGWVLCLGMSDAKAFGPYRPNTTMLHFCEKTAKNIWVKADEIRNNILSLNGIDFCKSFHPLCDYCDHSSDCLKFAGHQLKDPAYNDAFVELDKLKTDKQKLEKAISVRENRLRNFYEQTGLKDWLSTSDYRFRCSVVSGRNSLDTKALNSELVNILGEDKTNELIQKCATKNLPYQRLYVSKINPKKEIGL